ncbi:MAG: hypothetical protein ABIQ49_08280, partial [Gemmatimonadales bacterium]
MVPALADLLSRTPPAVLAALAVAVLAAVALLATVWVERRGRRRALAAAATAAVQLRTITSSMREGVIAYDMNLA